MSDSRGDKYNINNGQGKGLHNNHGSCSHHSQYHRNIKVLYDPSNPGGGASGSLADLWMAPIIFSAIGLVDLGYAPPFICWQRFAITGSQTNNFIMYCGLFLMVLYFWTSTSSFFKHTNWTWFNVLTIHWQPNLEIPHRRIVIQGSNHVCIFGHWSLISSL